MSRLALKASLALWQRRHAYRHKRLVAAIKAGDAAARKHWHALAAQAATMVKRRTVQLHQLQAVSISPAGVKLIARFEGCILHPYQDSVGVWTIGYGHTENVGPRTRPLASQAVALDLLHADLDHKYAPAVAALKLPLTQGQFDALTSFVYNLGPGYIRRGHTMGDALARHDWHTAGNAFLLYDRAGGRVLPGLAARRQAERSLFLGIS